MACGSHPPQQSGPPVCQRVVSMLLQRLDVDSKSPSPPPPPRLSFRSDRSDSNACGPGGTVGLVLRCRYNSVLRHTHHHA